jgi:transposase InsO family protein
MEQFYVNPIVGLVGPEKLQYRLRQQGKYVPMEKIREYYREQPENEVLKQVNAKKREIYRRVVADHIGTNIHIDLIDVSAYKRYNNGMRYILTGIDVYSRFGFLRLIRKKTPEDVLEAFLTIIPIIKPEEVSSDDGNEWKGVFKKYCKENNIRRHINIAGDHRANGLIERFNRTILDMIRRFCAINGNYKFDYVLHLLERNYNSSYHRTLKESPLEVFEREFRKVPQEETESLPELEGKIVRIKNDEDDLNFTRGLFREQYTRDLYKVLKLEGGRYVVQNIGDEKDVKKVSINDILISAGKKLPTEIRKIERRRNYSTRLLKRELESDIPEKMVREKRKIIKKKFFDEE